MKEKLSDKFLLLLAACLDVSAHAMSFSSALSYMSGHPRLTHHRRWVEKFIDNREKRKRLYNAFQNIIRRGYIKKKFYRNTEVYMLTQKGELKCFNIHCRENAKKKKLPRGQWIMIFYDIPETIKEKRNTLRRELHMLGFEMIQKSIWVSQYDIINEVRDLLRIYGIKKFVKLLTVKNAIGGDTKNLVNFSDRKN